MDGKENPLVQSGESAGGSTASGPSPCCPGACGGCPGCGGCPCPCGGCGPCGPCGCGGCCPCGPCGPCGCGCPRPGGPACPPGCGACPGACPCPGGCPTGCPGCCPGGCGACPGGCPGCPGMMGPMAGNNPMMAMMMMMNMQQMMAKAGGAAPQQGMNPMAAMMGVGINGAGSGPRLPADKEKPTLPQDDDETIDPDIRELGDYFNIEERWVVRLNEAMKKRQDSKAVDIEKLYEEKARSPTGLLTVQIGKMECGQFVGKIKPDKDVERMARKFKLDDPVTSRLTELKVWRKRNGEEDRATKVGKLIECEMDELPDLVKAEKIMTDYKLDEDACSKMREIIEKRYEDEDRVIASVRKHLNSASNASSMLCKIARQLIDGQDLPDPPERPPKGKGGGKDGGKEDGRRDGADRHHDRDRHRDRSRSRDRRERRDSRGR